MTFKTRLKTIRRGFRLPLLGAATGVLAVVAGCANAPQGQPRKEFVFAVTENMQLVKFNAGQPDSILARTAVTGLMAGDRLIGLDFRVAKGVLYALAQSGRAYTLDTKTGALTAIPAATVAVPLQGGKFGFDFNPSVDRMRIVSDSGLNLRIHPDTGAVIDGNATMPGVQPDSPLNYVQGDVHFGRAPAVSAVAYTYNTKNEKITTLYAIDRDLGTLAMQGSLEGVQPFVSPDTGRLSTVGPLGLGPISDAAFDISDIGNTALLATRSTAKPRTSLHLVDLPSGRTTLLGTVGDGSPVIGIAIEP